MTVMTQTRCRASLVLLSILVADTPVADGTTRTTHILPVQITFERVDDGTALPKEAFGGAELKQWIDSLHAGRTHPNMADTTLAGESRHLVRHNLAPATARDKMRAVCDAGRPDAVLFQYLRVKVGVPRGWKYEGVPLVFDSWKPVVNMNRTRLRTVARSCSNGEILWQDGFQIRALPRMGDPALEQAFENIYQQLR